MKTTFIIAVILLGYTANAQKLIFQKNRYRQVAYKVGEKITFQLHGDRSRFSGLIRGFEHDMIVFRDYKISPAEISHLYVDDKTRQWFVLRYKYEKLFFIAGAGYLLLELLNTGELETESVFIGGSFLTAALLARLLIARKIKVTGKRRVLWINEG